MVIKYQARFKYLLILWLPNYFCVSLPRHQIVFDTLSHLTPNFVPVLVSWHKIVFNVLFFCKPLTIWFYFVKNVSVLCKSVVYFFVENWILYKMVKTLSNSTPYKNSGRNLGTKNVHNNLQSKCIKQIFMVNKYHWRSGQHQSRRRLVKFAISMHQCFKSWCMIQMYIWNGVSFLKYKYLTRFNLLFMI